MGSKSKDTPSFTTRFRSAIVLFGFSVGLILLVFKPFFGWLDTRLRDQWFRTQIHASNPTEFPWLAPIAWLLPPAAQPKDIVLAVIDDRSVLGTPGLFQSDRRAYARLLRLIGEGNPSVIGLDVFFPGTASHDEAADKELAETVQQLGNVVLKAYRRGDQQMTPPFPALARSGIVAPTYFRPHVDEAVRTCSLFFQPTRGDAVLSFQAQLAKRHLRLDSTSFRVEPGGLTCLIGSETRQFSLVDSEHGLISYHLDPRMIPLVSAHDILMQTVSPTLFTGKIVIVGIATSMSEERYFTPLGRPEFSPFLHGLIVQNLITGQLLSPAVPFLGTILALALLAGWLLLAVPRLSPYGIAFLTFLTTIGLLGVSSIGLWKLHLVFEVTGAIFVVVATTVFAIGLRYYAERSEKHRIKNAFQHYVTASVVNEILKNPEKLNLHGEERFLTIFFSDIEGFTTLSEGMSPLSVVALLNEYLTQMTEIIFKFDGLLDKYEGDAIMSVFGAPVDQRDHAIRACRCALEHQKALERLRAKWKSEGKPEIRVRIGINSGNVVVGNMGSEMRFDYTVIGDNVNLAARLESANKLFHSDILISSQTAELVEGAILTRFLGMLRVVGRRQPVQVYEVLMSLDHADPELLNRQQAAKQAYEKALGETSQRRFSDALATLRAHLEQAPTDLPARMLLKRVESWLSAPPPDDW
ncbi:MAG TPA: adenylate/guanylate cyclase domain-containing protein, partial [Candidatus Ozemobacteraceae bacterium]|nr:adenylate/guanylate cyclase domain-containing protein [Candidatus Ozemobacteraceae bacterium]